MPIFLGYSADKKIHKGKYFPFFTHTIILKGSIGLCLAALSDFLEIFFSKRHRFFWLNAALKFVKKITFDFFTIFYLIFVKKHPKSREK